MGINYGFKLRIIPDSSLEPKLYKDVLMALSFRSYVKNNRGNMEELSGLQ